MRRALSAVHGLAASVIVVAQIADGPELNAANIVAMIEGRLGDAPIQGAGVVFAVQGDEVYICANRRHP